MERHEGRAAANEGSARRSCEYERNLDELVDYAGDDYAGTSPLPQLQPGIELRRHGSVAEYSFFEPSRPFVIVFGLWREGIAFQRATAVGGTGADVGATGLAGGGGDIGTVILVPRVGGGVLIGLGLVPGRMSG